MIVQLMPFHLIYCSAFSYVRFPSYGYFCITTPGVSQGYLSFQWVTPPWSTYQPASRINLS